MEEKKCPKCGSRDIEQGILSGYAAMRQCGRITSACLSAVRLSPMYVQTVVRY